MARATSLLLMRLWPRTVSLKTGRLHGRHRHVALVVLLALQLLGTHAEDAEDTEVPGDDADEFCSKGLGFNEAVVPKDRAFQDLASCNEHHKRTCCERNDTVRVLAAWASFGSEGSSRCVKMTQLAFCSVCDGDVGVGRKSAANTVTLCPSFCRRWFEACLEDFFAPSINGLRACEPNAVVCSPLAEITESDTDFCARIGGSLGVSFTVGGEAEEHDDCFDGIPSALTRGPGPKAPWGSSTQASMPLWRWLFPQPLDFGRFARGIKDKLPGLVIAFVLVIFVWHLWRSQD